MNKRNILIIAGWYPSKRNPIAGVFIKEHAKATLLHNDVVVLYSEGIGYAGRRLYEIDDNVEDGLRTLRLRYRRSPIPRTSYFVYLWSMFGALRKLRKGGFNPDVIHAHVYSAGIPAILMGKYYRVPVIISEHYSGFLRDAVRGFEKTKARFAFEKASVVCPVSENLQEHIQSCGIRARFHVVPNVVDMSLFSPGGNENKDMTAREGHTILFVGLLTPVKGIPYLLRAAARIKEKRNDFSLDIVGDGPSRVEYEELTNALGLAENVHFHGLKTKREVAEFMKRCDVFVLPSLFETFGVVLIEALACGKPVIATSSGGPNEIVIERVGKLVPPAEFEALAETIDYMLDHYQEYDAEGIARYARTRYSYEAVGREWDRIYKAILESPEMR